MASVGASVIVRPFEEADRVDLLGRVSLEAGVGSPGAELWGHEESLADVYLRPYLDLDPASVFVAVVDGVLAGYLAGCVDPTSFPSEEVRLDRAIREHRLMRDRAARRFFARAAFDLLVAKARRQPLAGELDDPRWPSHLHIDLVPAARGTGAAYALMDAWFEHLAALRSPGCYLQTLVENTRAVAFFQRVGFVAHGAPAAVPGVRVDGRRAHQLTMVRSVADG